MQAAHEPIVLSLPTRRELGAPASPLLLCPEKWVSVILASPCTHDPKGNFKIQPQNRFKSKVRHGVSGLHAGDFQRGDCAN